MARPVDERAVERLLSLVQSGDITVDAALSGLRDLPYERLDGDLKLDHHRELRTGQVEAVFGPGKTPGEVRDASSALASRATGAVFVTRATNDQFDAVRAAIPGARYHRRSGLVVVKPAAGAASLGTVAVVCAGTSDLAVGEEAEATAEAMGITVEPIHDVGVAGVHRLLDQREVIERADCAIVVAGMEGALPSVVAGLTSIPIVAVPTSVGYGASFQGLAALLAMLASCAPGIAVVNIDNGFGAAQVVHRILRAQG